MLTIKRRVEIVIDQKAVKGCSNLAVWSFLTADLRVLWASTLNSAISACILMRYSWPFSSNFWFMYVSPSLLDENPMNRNARKAFLKKRSYAFLLYLYMVSLTSEKSSSPFFALHLWIDSSLLCLCDRTTRDSIPVNSVRCQSFIRISILPKFASAYSLIS